MTQEEELKYIEHYRDVFVSEGGVSLTKAFEMWLEYCGNVGISPVVRRYRFRNELKKHFEKFEERTSVNGIMIRNYFSGFKGS